jgi:hypothetical protein
MAKKKQEHTPIEALEVIVLQCLAQFHSTVSTEVETHNRISILHHIASFDMLYDVFNMNLMLKGTSFSLNPVFIAFTDSRDSSHPKRPLLQRHMPPPGMSVPDAFEHPTAVPSSS